MCSLSSTSACYFLLLWEQTTFVFSCSLINKKHFYMGGLEWPFFPPLFRFPLFYILHTCSVSEAHFVIWNICGTLLWRRPTLLLLLLPVFISHWFADVGLRRLRLASAAPGLHSTTVGSCDCQSVLGVPSVALTLYRKVWNQGFEWELMQALVFVFLKKSLWIYLRSHCKAAHPHQNERSSHLRLPWALAVEQS